MKINEKKTLQQINGALEPLDDRLTAKFKGPKMPIVIILAQPRAGSTLLQQILGTYTDVGYITNFLAQFWSAPFIGAQVEQPLHLHNFQSNFSSRYGQTDGSLEPHEWGWFWRKWLDLDAESDYINRKDEIDWSNLNKKLGAIQFVKRAPIIFDNVFAGANLNVLYDNIPNILVVNLRRDLFFVCNSIINARISRHGHEKVHYGNRPRLNARATVIKDPIEQVVAQVEATENEFKETLGRIPSRDILTINYEDLTSTPAQIIIGFEKFLERHHGKLSLRNSDFVPHIKNRNDTVLINGMHYKRLKEIFSERFPRINLPSV